MYRTLAERLATAIPDLGLGADIIVGHPGESETDFEATTDLVRELPLSYLHVFAYSDRKGTEAAHAAERVPSVEIRERSRRLRALGDEKSLAFRQKLVGRTVDALVLQEKPDGRHAALTANYVEIDVTGPAAPARSFTRVRVARTDGRRTLGEREVA